MSNTNTDIILAGAAAAFTIDLLVYPLDTIKTRYQSQDYLKTYADSGGGGGARRHARASPFALRGLYQGVGTVIVATLPAAGIFFTTYEATKTFYSSLLGRLPLSDGLAMPAPLVHSLASGTAELASCLVLTPAEVIKQNAQMLRSEKTTAATTARGGSWRDSTSIRALRMVSQGGGASGAAHRLLTGYTALVARNLPFTAMQFPIFEAVRRRLWERRDRRTEGAGSGDVTVKDGSGSASEGERRIGKGVGMARGLLETGAVNGASAAVSGAIAAVVTTPTDVVKTRMMLSAGEERNVQEQRAPGSAPRGAGEAAAEHGARAHREGAVGRQNMSGMQVARLVYQERGMKGLFRGGLLRAGWTAVGSGLYLGTYEVAKVWLKGTAHEGEKL